LSKRDTIAMDNIGHGQDLHLDSAAVELDDFQVCPVTSPYQLFHNKFIALSLLWESDGIFFLQHYFLFRNKLPQVLEPAVCQKETISSVGGFQYRRLDANFELCLFKGYALELT
jgi:hypothetical protein